MRITRTGAFFFGVDALGEIDVLVGDLLVEVGEQLHEPARVVSDRLAADRPIGVDRAGRNHTVGRLVIVQGDSHLHQVVGALDSPRRLAARLDGGQQQRDENADDRNHHQ